MKILKENMRRFRTKNLSEQGPTLPPKPNFKPGELTDPNFMADWTDYALTTNAKQRRFKEFMKKQSALLNNYKKSFTDSGDGSPADFISWLGNIVMTSAKADVMLPANYIKYVLDEINRGNYPKSLKELSEWWNQSGKSRFYNPHDALENAIRNVKNK